MSPGQKVSTGNAETDKFDKQIESDIRSLQRSSRWLAGLGILAVVLLVTVVVFSVYDKALVINSAPSFIDIAFVKAPQAKVHAGPSEMFAVIKTYEKGEPLFLLEKKATWAKVQRRNITGWIRADQIQTKSERRKGILREGQAPIQILDVDWNVDEMSSYTILGKIENVTEIPVSNVKIIVNFFNKDGQFIKAKSTIVSAKKPFQRGKAYSFSVRGDYEEDFSFITTQVESWWE